MTSIVPAEGIYKMFSSAQPSGLSDVIPSQQTTPDNKNACFAVADSKGSS